MILNKSHLIRRIAAANGITQKQAKDIVRILIESMCRALAEGEAVALRGFGRFSVEKRARRVGRNFSTGEQLGIDPRNVVVFHASTALKTRLMKDRGAPERLGPFAEKRNAQRIEKPPKGRAVVRVAGIPVYHFEIKDTSEGGTSFIVENDSTLLRNIWVGQVIDIMIHVEDDTSARAVFQRSQIRHITRTTDRRNGNIIAIGVKILSQL